MDGRMAGHGMCGRAWGRPRLFALCVCSMSRIGSAQLSGKRRGWYSHVVDRLGCKRSRRQNIINIQSLLAKEYTIHCTCCFQIS